jgi:hypothetical protein
MDDLHKALTDISSIRRQVAHSTQFRGYGPATLAGTGLFAVLSAIAQAYWIPDPSAHLRAYLTLWIGTAVLSAALIGVQTVTRAHRIHSALADEMIHMAVEQFLPAVAAGVLLTIVLVRSVPAATWMLPGLWQIIFSLGIFSSSRFLPRPIIFAGAWYLLSGLTCLTLADNRALAPWTMGISYGVGQLLVAGVLYFRTQESGDEE